ncbi:MAG: sugar phosphate isomerase/epimerase and 4-hydroxyphenylpyruvate domain-containing protein [Rhodospirillales bacterium]|jgi:4-hydroxyphenylpyruvate dioxygenase|nr:sugar phosphate isomerase/epimerase and 4-hydroxyphenylpyruvate domain-containing protein [Rhodospirillales bacterium]
MPAAPARLPRSIATVTLAGTLPDKLEAAARAGFDAVEVFDADLLTFDGSPADIRRIAGDLGLAIVLWQPFRDFEAVEPARLARNLDRAERKFDVMAALGAPMMLVCSSTDPAALADDARASADLAALAARAAARGLTLGYEALAWGRHVNRWRHAWRIVEAAAHPALGLVLDSFHVLAAGDDLDGISQVPASRLAFVQLADAPLLSMDALSWSRHHRLFPGQGQLPVARFLSQVLDAGYAGPLSLEIFNDEMRAAPARMTARDGLRSLVLLEAEARPTVAAAALPPPPAYDGIEFLEFAIDAAGRDGLAAYLGALGFAYAGRHRSKSVELYRQGRANLILNSEPDSAAAEHFHLHGPAVCAMAFRVDDAARAQARAAALLAPPWHERTGLGERRIPALRAPDGTLIFLVEPDGGERTIYDDDFVLDPTAAEPDAALLEIDHVAQALPAGRMDGFVLFYKAVFGFEPQPLWELPDPYGLIRSRALVSADCSIRLPLNISEGRETATGRFVSAFAGAGVHHVAFACTDIEDAVSAALARGARMLPIPPNYYDDLAARLELAPGLLAKLQRLHLMYDRDEGGAYFQAYTASFQDRFFCEIVERRGYTQFGAANAGARLAAQSQRRADATLAARLALL